MVRPSCRVLRDCRSRDLRRRHAPTGRRAMGIDRRPTLRPQRNAPALNLIFQLGRNAKFRTLPTGLAVGLGLESTLDRFSDPAPRTCRYAGTVGPPFPLSRDLANLAVIDCNVRPRLCKQPACAPGVPPALDSHKSWPGHLTIGIYTSQASRRGYPGGCRCDFLNYLQLSKSATHRLLPIAC
jgi:hypothetical protein